MIEKIIICTSGLRMAQENGSGVRIVEAAIEVNAAQKARMIRKIRDSVGGNEAGKIIGVLGLTFKPETDDMRDSPSLAILPAMADEGALIPAHDPEGIDEARKGSRHEIKGIDPCHPVIFIRKGLVILREAHQKESIVRIKVSADKILDSITH